MNTWRVEKHGWHPDRLPQHNSIFTICNGYWALKGLLLEDRGAILPTTIVNGVYDLCNMFATIPPSKEKRWYLEEDHFDKGAPSPSVANLPSPVHVRAFVDGVELCVQRGVIEDFTQALDLRDAVYTYSYVYTDEHGRRTRIEMARFCDATAWHVAHLRYTLTPLNYSARLRLVSGIDGAVRSNVVGDVQLDVTGMRLLPRRGCLLAARTRDRRIDVQVAIRNAVSVKNARRRALLESARIAEEFDIRLTQGVPVTLEKQMVICTSEDARHGVDADVTAELAHAARRGFTSALRAHSDQWRTWWQRADVVISGDDLAQLYLRFCLHHLIAAAPKHTDKLSVPVKLLTGEYYQGNTFYDTDTYIVPFYTHVMPQWSRACLRWRHLGLEPARAIARAQGYRGAKFAWQAGPYGEECLGQWWRFIHSNIHINADVVYALLQYAEVTGDTDFLLGVGLEILVETARFYTSRAEYDAANDCYHLHGVAGPDEGHCTSTDNFYTNYLAQQSLLAAAALVEQHGAQSTKNVDCNRHALSIDPSEIAQWREVGHKLRFLFDPRTRIYEQYDGFYQLEDVSDDFFARRRDRKEWFAPVRRYQAIHQPDVTMAMLLYRHQFADDVFAANHRFYYPRTMNFSSMSYGLNAMACKEVGDMDGARENFLITAGMDIDEELTGRGDTAFGMHGTACGGAWLAVVPGFVGAAVRDGCLYLKPRLPKGWQAVTFTLVLCGTPYRLCVTHDAVEITAEDAASPRLPVEIWGRRVECWDGATLRVAYRADDV